MVINRTLFFASIKKSLFKGKLSQSQVNGINSILDEWDYRWFADRRWLAYILATVFHETATTMQPVTEYGGEKYLKSKPYYPYYGRDLTQTTWLQNYEKVKRFTGVDVVSNPELIKDLKVSAKVAIEFMVKGYYTGKKLSDYFSGVIKNDPFNARRIINGVDKAGVIKGYYDRFLASLS